MKDQFKKVYYIIIDTFENLSYKAIQLKIDKKEDLVSNFPEDIFHYIND